jgi:hypothetical protein
MATAGGPVVLAHNPDGGCSLDQALHEVDHFSTNGTLAF